MAVVLEGGVVLQTVGNLLWLSIEHYFGPVAKRARHVYDPHLHALVHNQFEVMVLYLLELHNTHRGTHLLEERVQIDVLVILGDELEEQHDEEDLRDLVRVLHEMRDGLLELLLKDLFHELDGNGVLQHLLSRSVVQDHLALDQERGQGSSTQVQGLSDVRGKEQHFLGDVLEGRLFEEERVGDSVHEDFLDLLVVVGLENDIIHPHSALDFVYHFLREVQSVRYADQHHFAIGMVQPVEDGVEDVLVFGHQKVDFVHHNHLHILEPLLGLFVFPHLRVLQGFVLEVFLQNLSGSCVAGYFHRCDFVEQLGEDHRRQSQSESIQVVAVKLEVFLLQQLDLFQKTGCFTQSWHSSDVKSRLASLRMDSLSDEFSDSLFLFGPEEELVGNEAFLECSVLLVEVVLNGSFFGRNLHLFLGMEDVIFLLSAS